MQEAEQQLAQYSDQVSRLQEEMTKMTLSHNQQCQKLQMQVMFIYSTPVMYPQLIPIQLDNTISQCKAENEVTHLSMLIISCSDGCTCCSHIVDTCKACMSK